jgi:allantoicase
MPPTKNMANFPEVSSSAVGGKVLACSDDFFVSKDNLIKPNVSFRPSYGGREGNSQRNVPD